MAAYTGFFTLADDTGLFVDALHGAPGVHSARYAGENCSYWDNRLKMLNEMKNIENRQAHFKTCVALVDDKGNLLHTTEGVVEGEITQSEKGTKGFGYDSIFYCPELKKTFSEMDSEEKHRISHRGRAFRLMLPFLKKVMIK